jgi:preprotein translocase subunit YajC
MGAPGGGAEGQAPSMLQSMLPLIIIFAIFYFLIIRPQQKKAKEHKAVLEGLKKGDRVLTNGGIYGEVYALTPEVVTLVISEGVKIKVARGYIAGLAGQEETKE